MIIKTQAIAARTLPYSETSRVLVWLTRDHGKLVTLLKGAHRRRSPFTGQFDLFYTCEVLVYLRTFRGVHVVKECAALKPRAALRTRWRAAACASYFTDLVARASPVGAPHPGVFGVLDAALDYFAEQPALELGLFWFELRLMKELGLEPHLARCVACGGALLGAARPAGRGIVFSCARGGALCAECARGAPADALPLSPSVLGTLRFWQRAASWRAAPRSACSPAQVSEIERLLGAFLQHHLECGLPARGLALETVRLVIP